MAATNKALYLNKMKRLGLSFADAAKLLTLEKIILDWNIKECNGDIQRDDPVGVCRNGLPKRYIRDDKGKRICTGVIDDLEAKAIDDIKVIMLAYPEVDFYIQGDCRGCMLYLYRKDEPILERYPIDSCYSSIGYAVCI